MLFHPRSDTIWDASGPAQVTAQSAASPAPRLNRLLRALRADIHATIGTANIRPPKLFASRGRYMILSGRSKFAPRNSQSSVWRFMRPSGRGEFAHLNFSPVPARSDTISRNQPLRKERPLVPPRRRIIPPLRQFPAPVVATFSVRASTFSARPQNNLRARVRVCLPPPPLF